MAGVVPLVSFTPSHGRSSSFRSGASSSTCTQHHGRFPHHQLHNNGVFGASTQKWHNMDNSKRKQQSLGVQNEVNKTAETEQGNSASAATTSPSSNSSSLPTTLQQGLEEMGSWDKEHPYKQLQVFKRWREIQGEKRWEGLLDPFDDDLRGEIIRYGEFAQLPYDAYDYDSYSPFCGSCKYAEARLFKKMGLENRGYEVADYIYATEGAQGGPLAKYFKLRDPVDKSGNEKMQDPWDSESIWIGFVAVTTDPAEIKRLGRRDILVVWRGSTTKLEWIADFSDYTAPAGLDPRGAERAGKLDVKVESGFLQLYKSDNPKSKYTKKSARRQSLEAVARLVSKYADKELSITVTGHSLGAALALLSAYDIAETGVNQASNLPGEIPHWDKPDKARDPNAVVEMTKSMDVKTVPVTLFSFAGPRVGNDAFRERTEELGVKVLRVVNVNDMIWRVPGLFMNERLNFLKTEAKWFWSWIESLPWTYSHVGVPFTIDNTLSPFLRVTRDPNHAHNLEGYLHVVSGFHGLGKRFAPAIYRDIALVNKFTDFVHPKYKIPISWWQEENKGLVRSRQGTWIVRPREEVDYPQHNIDTQEADNPASTLSSIQ